MNADLKTAAARRVSNGRRQHGNPARAPRQPGPPPAQAGPRAARPARNLAGHVGDAGRTLYVQLADALAGVLIPTPAERSFGAEIQPLQGMSGTEDAIAAAKAGDIALLDRFELAWLNSWGPRPTPPEDVPVQMLDENGWELLALEILHGGDETMIEWGFVKPCPRCWKRPSKRNDCRKCEGWGFLGGRGHEEYAIWRFQTDTDLNVVGDIDESSTGGDEG